MAPKSTPSSYTPAHVRSVISKVALHLQYMSMIYRRHVNYCNLCVLTVSRFIISQNRFGTDEDSTSKIRIKTSAICHREEMPSYNSIDASNVMDTYGFRP